MECKEEAESKKHSWHSLRNPQKTPKKIIKVGRLVPWVRAIVSKCFFGVSGDRDLKKTQKFRRAWPKKNKTKTPKKPNKNKNTKKPKTKNKQKFWRAWPKPKKKQKHQKQHQQKHKKHPNFGTTARALLFLIFFGLGQALGMFLFFFWFGLGFPSFFGVYGFFFVFVFLVWARPSDFLFLLFFVFFCFFLVCSWNRAG